VPKYPLVHPCPPEAARRHPGHLGQWHPGPTVSRPEGRARL